MRNVLSDDRTAATTPRKRGSNPRLVGVALGTVLFALILSSAWSYVQFFPAVASGPAGMFVGAVTLLAGLLLVVLVYGVLVGSFPVPDVTRRRLLIYSAVTVALFVPVAAVGAATEQDLLRLSTLLILCVVFALSMYSTVVGLVAAVLGVVVSHLLAGTNGNFFVVAMFGDWALIRLVIWVRGMVAEIDDSRRMIAALSVERERGRFSRDLHDVVGRTLAAVSLKTELALESDTVDGKDTELREIQVLARRTLGETRALVRGYREIDLSGELDDACHLLRSDGVFVEVVGDDGARLDHAASQVAGWVVREAVTNILKHAPGAEECQITIDGPLVEITNDGAGGDEPTAPRSGDGSADGAGSGLEGLRERVDAVGGSISSGVDGEWFTLRCRFPEARGARGSTR